MHGWKAAAGAEAGGPCPGTTQRLRSRGQRPSRHRQDQTARTSGAARRPGRRFHGTRKGVREERHGSETQIGRRRPHEKKPGGDVGAARAVESVEDAHLFGRRSSEDIRSRIGNKHVSQTSTRRPEPWADLRLARRPSCLARADRSRDSERNNEPEPGTSRWRRHRNCDGLEDWPRDRGAEVAEGQRPRIGRGAATE